MIETLRWVINTPGIGGMIAMGVFTVALSIFGSLLYWLQRSALPSDRTERCQ